MASTYELIVKAVDQTSGPMNKIQKSLKEVGSEATKANKSLEAAGGSKVTTGFSSLGSAIGKIPAGFAAVTAAAATVGLAFNKILDATREFERIQNSLRLITNGTAELAQTTSMLRNMAEQNRTSFAATADLYTKLSISTKELGYSSSQVAAITTKLSQALAVAGADAGTANGVIRQFGQAMASGTVRGDEFNSIVEGLGPALAIMARESGLTVGELRKMSQAGQLTADKFAQLLLSSNALNDSFNKMQPTISNLETKLSDAFDKFLVDLGEASGFTKQYGMVVNGLAVQFQTLSLLINATNNDIGNVGERLAFASKWANRLQIEIDKVTKAGDANGIQAKILTGILSLLNLSVENLTKQYTELKDVQDEITRQTNRAAAAEADRVNALNASKNAAMATWKEFEKLATQSLGTDSAYELADAMRKAMLDSERLAAAQSALNKALKEGAVIENSTNLLKGLAEAQKIAEGRLAELIDKERMQTDIVYRSNKEYENKAEALRWVTDNLDDYNKMTDRGVKLTDQQKYVVSALTTELQKLQKELGINTSGNFGSLISSQSIAKVEEAKEKLKSVEAELANWQKRMGTFQTLDMANKTEISVVALKKEKAALEELIRTAQGYPALAKPFSELFRELEAGVNTSVQAAQTNKILFQTFDDGKRSVAELTAARQLLNIEEKTGNTTVQDTINQLANKNAALAAIDAALLRTRELTAGTTVTEQQLTKSLEDQRRALLGLEQPYYDKLIEGLDKANKLTKDQEAAHSALNWKYLEGAINIDTYKAALKVMASEGFEPAQKHLDNMITLSEMLDSAFKKSTENMASNLAKSLVSGKASLSSFKDYFNQVLDDIATAIIQKNITQPLVDGISSFVSAGLKSGGSSGGFIDSVIGFFTGGGKANGGIISGNKPTLVGERGPELFMPNTTGSIVPREQLNTGGGQTVVNFNLTAVDTQTGVEFLLKNKPSIIGMITQAQNQRGRQGITS